MSMEKIFADLANEHTLEGGQDRFQLQDDFRKMYEAGRASMLIELELKKNLEKFVFEANPEGVKKEIKALMMEKLTDFHARGLIAPAWEPKFHVEKSKEDPNRIDIIPDDEETARLFKTMQQPGNY